MADLETWLDRVYQAGGDRATLDRHYDEWARDYDRQIWASGNPYTAILLGFAGRYLPEFGAEILDAGCGTGNMGLLLYQMGYEHIDGLDPSTGMLELARRKGVYRALHPLYLDSDIDLPDAGYDAVIAAGVLTHGHAPPRSLDAILKLTRAGGVILFSLSRIAHDDHGFGQRIAELDREGAWEALGHSRLFRTYPFSEQAADLRHWVMAYRKR